MAPNGTVDVPTMDMDALRAQMSHLRHDRPTGGIRQRLGAASPVRGQYRDGLGPSTQSRPRMGTG
jgi:hypothetical protein